MTQAAYQVRRLIPRTGMVAIVLALMAPTAVIVTMRPRSGVAQAVGDLAILLAALAAVAGCLGASRRRGPDANGWLVMAVATGVWSLGQLAYTYYGLSRNHVYPFPSAADIGYIGCAFPAAARAVMDAMVIAASLLLMSWVTVLGPLTDTAGTGLTRIASLAFPIVDIVVASLRS